MVIHFNYTLFCHVCQEIWEPHEKIGMLYRYDELNEAVLGKMQEEKGAFCGIITENPLRVIYVSQPD